jgi:hypothetical protein
MKIARDLLKIIQKEIKYLRLEMIMIYQLSFPKTKISRKKERKWKKNKSKIVRM